MGICIGDCNRIDGVIGKLSGRLPWVGKPFDVKVECEV